MGSIVRNQDLGDWLPIAPIASWWLGLPVIGGTYSYQSLTSLTGAQPESNHLSGCWPFRVTNHTSDGFLFLTVNIGGCAYTVIAAFANT